MPDRFKRSTGAWSNATNYAIGAYVTNVHGGKTKVYRATAQGRKALRAVQDKVRELFRELIEEQ